MKSPQAKVFIMFIAAFAMALASCSSNDGKSLPTSDSIYTSEYINKICRTKPQEALDILDEAEKTQKMRTVKINVLRTMIYIDAYYDTNKGGVSVTFDTPPSFLFMRRGFAVSPLPIASLSCECVHIAICDTWRQV